MPQPPDLDANGQPVGTKPPDLDAHGQPVSGDAGFFQGIYNTLPTPSHLLEAVKAIPGNINRAVGPNALEDLAKTTPNTPIGKMRNGRPMEGAGELVGSLGQLALGELGTSYLRGRVIPTGPAEVGGIPVKDLDAARINSDTFSIGQGSRDILANGRPTPRVVARPSPPTRGNLALQSEPTPAPLLTRPDLVPVGDEAAYNVAHPKPTLVETAPQTPKEQVLRDLVSRPDIVQQAKQMQLRAANARPTAQPAAASLPDYLSFNKMTPDEFKFSEWHSEAEPGSADAESMAATHRYEAESANRLKHMLANQNGEIPIGLLQKFGWMPVRYGAAAAAAKQVGLPGWTGAAGMGAYDLATANPSASVGTLRAALAARLAAESARNSSTPTGR